MKIARQAEILKLIEQYNIETQDELVAILARNGFTATQSTVSRDIRELNLTKVAARDGHVRYAAPRGTTEENRRKYIGVLREAFVSMQEAGNILVIRTAPGMAMAAAAVLDDMEDLNIPGTIAGDNTIFCATESRDAALTLMGHLQEMLSRYAD